MEQSVAPKTMRSYNMAMASFNAFRQSLGYSSITAATTEQLSEFIGWLSLRSRAPATILQYVAGVSFYHKIQSLPDPANSFVIKKLMSATRRGKRSADKRLPIQSNLLGKLISVLTSVTASKYESTLFRTAFILAYFGFLRLGEIVADNRGATGGLRASDVSVQRTGGGDAVIIDLRHTKTSQYGRSQVIKLREIPGSAMCPFQAVHSYNALRPKGASAFLCHFDGSQVTRHQFQAILRKAAIAAGLDPRLYTSHSFRIGAATSAAEAGFSPQQIKEGGRWRSDAYKSYIRPTTAVPPCFDLCK